MIETITDESMEANAPSLAELEAILEFYHANGIEHGLDEVAHNRFEENEREQKERATTKAPTPIVNNTRPAPPSPKPTYAPQSDNAAPPGIANSQAAQETAGSALTLEALHQSLSDFDGCNLKRTAKNLVFSDGNPEAHIMLIGETPDRDEDLQGIPFIGLMGELLNNMLASIGLERQNDVYLTHLVPWRPPGNRAPTQLEFDICLPFIQRQIDLVKPDLLVLFGGPVAKQLIGISQDVSSLRGMPLIYNQGEHNIETIVTYHPAYLLRQPAQKRLAWQDLQLIKARLAP